MINLYKENLKYITKSYFSDNNDYLLKLVNYINNEKIIIISWIKYIWKTDLIRSLIKRTKIENKIIYFNKDLDTKDIIKTSKDLLEYIEKNKNGDTKYIILQNISQIESIKEFLNNIFASNYKIIIIWNDIKISSIKELEIKNKIINKNYLKYWNLSKTRLYSNESPILEEYVNLIKNDIFLNKIFKLKWVKNISLYYDTINLISRIKDFVSINELHRQLSSKNMSVLTLTDYINFSIQEKVLKKVELYDFKKEKIINWKSKYYFTDNWLRNSLNYFNLTSSILFENMIFNILDYFDYEIFSWINWVFSFHFIARKNKEDIYIYVQDILDDKNLKEINKWFKKLDKNFNKYIVYRELNLEEDEKIKTLGCLSVEELSKNLK